MNTKYEQHPIGQRFPPMDSVTREETKLSLGQHGLKNPIILWEDKILDGWNRYTLMSEMGMTFFPAHFKKFEGTEEQAVALVIINNLNRRHLTTAQRAAIAVHFLEEAVSETKEKRRNKEVNYRSPDHVAKGKSRDIVANLFNVSSQTLQNTRFVYKHSPTIFKKMVEGKLFAHVAYRKVRKEMGNPIVNKPGKINPPREEGVRKPISVEENEQAIEQRMEGLGWSWSASCMQMNNIVEYRYEFYGVGGVNREYILETFPTKLEAMQYAAKEAFSLLTKPTAVAA